MNLQAIVSLDGSILWVSGALPGSAHDKKAEWIRASWPSWRPPAQSSWPIRAAGRVHAVIPYRRENKVESQKQARRAHARLRPSGGANAQLKTWRILCKPYC